MVSDAETDGYAILPFLVVSIIWLQISSACWHHGEMKGYARAKYEQANPSEVPLYTAKKDDVGAIYYERNK